jgi:hypothetical protein
MSTSPYHSPYTSLPLTSEDDGLDVAAATAAAINLASKLPADARPHTQAMDETYDGLSIAAVPPNPGCTTPLVVRAEHISR